MSSQWAPRSFGAANQRPEPELEPEDNPSTGPSKKLLVSCVGLSAAGVLLLLGGLMGAVGAPAAEVPEQVQAEARNLLMQTQQAEKAHDALPEAKRANRALVKAGEAAEAVTRIQNSMGYQVVQHHAGIDMESSGWVQDRQRSMSPYFVPDIDPEVLSAWYLLDSDKTKPLGSGIPMLFASEATWSNATPRMISEDGLVPVTWTLTQQLNGSDRATMLAWVNSSYDPQRQMFVSMQLHLTEYGKQLEWQPPAQGDPATEVPQEAIDDQQD